MDKRHIPQDTQEVGSQSAFHTPTGPQCAEADLRVLLVDDHADALTVMNLLFKRHSYQVQTAESGQRALELARDWEPHVVVSDLSMPDMNGYEMMTKMREDGELKPFKSIALSGYDREDDREKSRRAGFDAHLTKPIDFQDLFATVKTLAQQPHQ